MKRQVKLRKPKGLIYAPKCRQCGLDKERSEYYRGRTICKDCTGKNSRAVFDEIRTDPEKYAAYLERQRGYQRKKGGQFFQPE